MKKYLLIIYMVVMVTIISGCAVNADANMDITYPELTDLAQDSEEPYRFNITETIEQLEAPTVVEREATEIAPGGASWIYAKTQEGTRGTKITKYKETYNLKDELLSRVEIPEAEEIHETQPTVYEGGQPAQPGAYYEASRITRYGVDCEGCNVSADGIGGTASGVALSTTAVRQSDGTWRKGITYDGYYVIATSSTIPMCSIVEISDHTVSGKGIEYNVPFKAMVLDRGGAIQGSKIDLFVGTETNMGVIQGSLQNAHVEILSVGGGC